MTREEAIEVVKKNWPDSRYTLLREALETLIPELCESEDERIRNEIIVFLSDCANKKHRVVPAKFFTYLEKQKEEADKRLERVELHCKEVQEFDKKIKALRKEWYGEEQKEQDECPEYCVRSHCMGCSIYEKQKERKPIDVDYISGIREELLGIENNARNIDGLTESQWVAIRAAHRLLGEYIEKEQKPAEWNANDKGFIKDCARKLDEIGYTASAERLLSMFPVRPAEWSEEDERMLERAIHIIVEYSDIDEKESEIVQNWLKSLRPQWRPSEEQMEALKHYVDTTTDGEIDLLYNDLKKLM